MDAAHPLGVALGEVVVDRDDVDAVAGERVEVRRQRGDQGLALTGLHLGDVAEVQRAAAHDLDVVVPLTEGALGRLADGGEGLREQLVEGLALGVPLLVLVGLRAQLGVAEVDEVVLERVDLDGDGLELLDHAAFAGAEDLVEELTPVSSLSALGAARGGHVGWAGLPPSVVMVTVRSRTGRIRDPIGALGAPGRTPTESGCAGGVRRGGMAHDRSRASLPAAPAPPRPHRRRRAAPRAPARGRRGDPGRGVRPADRALHPGALAVQPSPAARLPRHHRRRAGPRARPASGRCATPRSRTSCSG